jgi:hypothetical protein
MNRQKSFVWLYILAVLVVSGLVALFFWDAVRDAVVYPLYYIGWLILLVINSFSQDLYLGLLIIAGVIAGLAAVIRLLPGARGRLAGEAREMSQSRYRFWRGKNIELETSEYFRNSFALEARRLVLDMLAHQESLTPVEAEWKVRQGLVEVPPEVRYLVETRELRSMPGRKTSRWDRLFPWLGRRSRSTQTQEGSRLVAYQVEAILKFLEERLEITHD